MKRRTTARGAPLKREAMEKAWITAWADLPQDKIQEWIAAIPHHIQEIIRLKGGNEYKEGVKGFKRSWAGTRLKGKLSKLESIDGTQHQGETGDNSDGEQWVDVEDEDV